ncbi:hypothetical protein VII_003305 [Vibrio mimicus MB451]|nr:hypothetical protein VII_003305 [Vibrio mimicus MB451]
MPEISKASVALFILGYLRGQDEFQSKITETHRSIFEERE